MQARRAALNDIALWLGAAALLVAIGLFAFGSAGRDDCYITFWPAHTLARFHEILNYNGQRLEQSSSLLHVLLLAAVEMVTNVQPHVSGFPLAIAFGAFAVTLCGALAKKLELSRWVPVVAATSVPLVYWSFGGLESSLAAALLCGLVLAVVNRNTVEAVLCLGLAVMVRPEMPFVLGAALAIAWWRSRQGFYGKLLMWTVALSLALFAFRFWYFGELFPHPVLAKVGGLRPLEGLLYVAAGLPLVLMGCATVGLKEPLVPALVGVTLAFCVAVGGDWMECGRFLVPIVPLAALGASRFRYWAVLAGLAWPWFVTQKNTGLWLWQPRYAVDGGWFVQSNKTHARDAMTLLPMVKVVVDSLKDDQPTVVLTRQMGYLPYHLSLVFYGRLKFVDLLGLADDTLKDVGPAEATPYGRMVPYPVAIQKLHPDIVFDVGRAILPQVRKSGYRVVYRQDFKFGDFDAFQFIAVP